MLSRKKEKEHTALVEPEPSMAGDTVDSALDAWRHKATDILLAAVAIAHLPVIILGWLGHGPPMGPLAKSIGLGIYIVVAAGALSRPIDYRKRLLASFVAIYIGLIGTNIYFSHGPYAKSVITLPVFVLVLLGPRAAKIAIWASTATIVFAALLTAQVSIVRALATELGVVPAPTGLVWFQMTVMAASLFALMLMLERFHRLLLDTLNRCLAAQRKIETDMRDRQQLEREIASVGDEERRHLGQELHDGVCQQVTAALLHCQALERRVQRGGTLSVSDFTPLSSLLVETIDDTHNVARGLCPLEPEPEALASALRALTKRIQEMLAVPCEFHANGDVNVVDAEAAQHLYRIGQEALSNAARHANATRIVMELSRRDGELILQVKDDGIGLPAELPASGMGLRTMLYRAQILGGKLLLEPAPGGGTRVLCSVPVSPGVLATGHHDEATDVFKAHR